MSTQTITEFLEARIAEDEAEAKWVEAEGDNGSSPVQHPSRVLAECAAKRAVISNVGPYSCSQAHSQFDVYHPDGHLSPVIRALAAVYKDHADYREEWA